MKITIEAIAEDALDEAIERRDFLFYLGSERPKVLFHNIDALANISQKGYDNGKSFYFITSDSSSDFASNCTKLLLDILHN